MLECMEKRSSMELKLLSCFSKNVSSKSVFPSGKLVTGYVVYQNERFKAISSKKTI